MERMRYCFAIILLMLVLIVDIYIVNRTQYNVSNLQEKIPHHRPLSLQRKTTQTIKDIVVEMDRENVSYLL